MIIWGFTPQSGGWKLENDCLLGDPVITCFVMESFPVLQELSGILTMVATVFVAGKPRVWVRKSRERTVRSLCWCRAKKNQLRLHFCTENQHQSLDTGMIPGQKAYNSFLKSPNVNGWIVRSKSPKQNLIKLKVQGRWTKITGIKTNYCISLKTIQISHVIFERAACLRGKFTIFVWVILQISPNTSKFEKSPSTQAALVVFTGVTFDKMCCSCFSAQAHKRHLGHFGMCRTSSNKFAHGLEIRQRLLVKTRGEDPKVCRLCFFQQALGKQNPLSWRVVISKKYW